MADRSYAVALVLTLVVELPVWSLLGSWAAGVSRGRALAVGVAVNVVSHPLLWFGLVPLLGPAMGQMVVTVIVAEGVVVVVESLLAWRLLPARLVVAGGLALIANAASFGAGLVFLR